MSIEEYLSSDSLQLVRIGWELLLQDDSMTNQEKDDFLVENILPNSRKRNDNKIIKRKSSNLHHISIGTWYFFERNVARTVLGRLV